MKRYFINYRSFAIAVAIALLPAVGFSQEAEDQPVQEDPQVERPSGSSTNSGLSSSPWGGNSSSTPAVETQQQRPGANPTNPALRPVGGSTVLADPAPGGNPDVPFDDNMNLGFLAVGIVFAFVVFRKSIIKKPVTVSK